MTKDQKRETIVRLLYEIDRDRDAALYTTKSTRLGMRTVGRLYTLLANEDETSTWGLTVDQLRDRLRLAVLGSHGYDDSFDGRPLRSGELAAIIRKLEKHHGTDDRDS